VKRRNTGPITRKKILNVREEEKHWSDNK